MKRYLKIYRALIKINFSSLLAHKANFINNIVSTMVWALFQLVWVGLLTFRTKSAYGWSRQELILLAASYVFMIGFLHMFFTRNFDRLSQLIDRGGLDNLLIKPLDSQFIVSCWYINLTQIVRLILGSSIIFYLINTMHLHVTIINAIGYAILILSGVILMYSIWFLFSTSLIWFPRLTNIIDFLYMINGAARFPPEMIRESRNFVLLFLIPFTLTLAVPTRVLIQRVMYGDMTELIVLMFVLFIISRIFWKFALRSYTSASS